MIDEEARKMKILLGIMLPLALVAGCGDASKPVAGTTGAPTRTNPAATSTSAAPARVSCAPAAIVPVLKRRLGAQIVRADVVRCRKSYARVNAVPDASSCPPNCFQQLEAYLHWTHGQWVIVDSGSGIECEDTTTLPPLPLADRRACRALGYPQPTIMNASTFQMPSRNIGCAMAERLLRCDILSGLKPEPRRRCELDWVGLLLPASGPAHPNCAGDTVYDAGAPILAYGEMWHRASLWCESQPSGLVCSNPRDPRGGSFGLSRENWHAD